MVDLKKARLEHITLLDLSDNQIDGDGIKALVSSHFPELQSLSINDNKIYNRGMSYLAKGNWPKIKYLQVLRC
jgi:Ran GTPase-activating protein (RanGAP) involved in mRNA processing and transport